MTGIPGKRTLDSPSPFAGCASTAPEAVPLRCFAESVGVDQTGAPHFDNGDFEGTFPTSVTRIPM